MTAPGGVVYKPGVTLGGDLWRVGEALVAFAIAPLPEPLKRRGWLSAYLSPLAHAASGLAEVFVSAGLFIAGMVPYLQAFSSGPGLTYLENQKTLDYGDFFGVGALGYVSYLVRPTSLLLVYCLGEGIARALQAAVWEECPGIALLAVPWRVVVRLRRGVERANLASLLGPPRPDEIVAADASRSRLFEVYSCAEKPWSDGQVVEHGERFYQLATRRLVRRGTWYAYRYQFHPLEEREVIRGTIVRLAAGGEPPAP